MLLSKGKLAVVTDLSCKKHDFCTLCNWSPPFSLTSTSQYLFNISNDNTLLSTNSTTDSNMTYCPSQYGYYSISVAATNNAGLGDVSYQIVNITPTGMVLDIVYILSLHAWFYFHCIHSQCDQQLYYLFSDAG